MTGLTRIYGFVAASVITVVALSCSKFSYTEPEYEESSVYIAISGDKDSEFPYRVVMSRLVNSCHYVWEADTASHAVRLGEYYAFAYRASDLYTITSIDQFEADPSVSMQDIYAALPLDEEDYGKMSDINPYTSFIKSAEEVLEMDYRKVSVADSAMVLFFKPTSVTQTITFRLNVKPGAGVSIENMSAAISGVPSKVKLMSGTVRNDDDTPTYRQYVKMKKVGASDTYEGKASVLGLFPPLTSLHTTGPGIFQVAVEAVVVEDGVEYRRVFYAGINMKTAIEKAALMQQMQDGSGYKVRRSAATIEIPVVLDVRADKIFPGKDEGIEQWFINDADVEVEI